MIINAATLQAIRTGFHKHFQDGQNGYEPQFSQIATVIPSTTAVNTYGWLGEFPGFREWIGDRVLKNMKEKAYQISNKDYESSVGVKANDIKDDNLGIYQNMFNEAGRASRMLYDELVFPLLLAGETNTCYDGQYFFDTDHPVNDQNDGQGSDTSVSNMIVDGDYAGDTWYMLCTTRSLKPFILQEREKIKFTSMTKEDDEAVFMRKEYRYGMDGRLAAGFGFWQMAIAIKADLNAENYWKAVELMKSFTADGGRKLGLKPNLMVVPGTLEQKATKLQKRENIEEGNTTVTNELKGMFELLVAEQL